MENTTIIRNKLEELKKIPRAFYQNFPNLGYQLMEQGTTLILEIMDMLSKECAFKQYPFAINELNGCLVQALTAYEKRDTILFADIMHFEIIAYFEEVLEQM